MEQFQADQVSKFVKYWYNKVDYLIVQCEAGISRSAGVAAAISKWTTGNDEKYFSGMRFVPNHRCYTMVLNSLMNE